MQKQYYLLLLPLILLVILTASDKNVEIPSKSIGNDASLCEFSRGKCLKSIGNINIELSMDPDDAPSEKPIKLNMLFSENVDVLSVRLEGRDMFMGVIPVNIHQMDKNHYQGQFIYGSCSSGYMVWRGFIDFNKNGEKYTAIFDFLADSPK
nr:hypothetical protein [Shewanella acanthi]